MFSTTQDRLSQILNESAISRSVDSGFEVYGLGTLEDIVARAGSMMNEAAIGLAVAGCESRPYFLEAGINAQSGRPSDIEAFDAISEGIISSGIEQVKKWLEIAKKTVKAIIEKIKLSLAAMTGKTDKWVAMVKPMLDKKGAKDASEFVYTGAPWAEKDITKVTIDFQVSKLAEKIAELKKYADDAVAGKELIHKFADSKELKRIADVKIEDAMKDVFGVETQAEMKEEMSKELKGKASKVDIKGFREIDARGMLAMIEGVTKFDEALTKLYDGVEKELSKTLQAYDKAESAMKNLSVDKLLEGEPEDKKAELRDKINSAKSEATALMAKATSVTNATLQMVNTKISVVRSLVNEQKSEYMKILTKYAKAAPVK